MRKVKSLLVAVVCSLAPGVVATWAADSPDSQQQIKRPRTISTRSAKLVGKCKFYRREFEINGIATFTVNAANSDDTVGGVLEYTIPEDLSKEFRQATGKDIPAKFVVQDVIASFERNAKCPELRFEFYTVSIYRAGVNIFLENFLLTLDDSEKDLFELFCRWADGIRNGRSHPQRSIVPRLNRIFQGEEVGDK